MIKNYFLTALRNLRRNRIFSGINILGLSIGISAALVIFLIVQYDFSFEKSWKDGSRIYRVVTEMHFAQDVIKNSGVPQPLSTTPKPAIPGIEVAAPFWTANPKVFIPQTSDKPIKPLGFKQQDYVI